MKKTYGKRPLTDEEAAECAELKGIYNAKKKDLKLTQDELGERLGGVGQSGVSHYLNGINALNAYVAAGFARELQVSVSDFSPRLAASHWAMACRCASRIFTFQRFRSSASTTRIMCRPRRKPTAPA